MDTPARQHRREQLREAQRRSRQRRQEAMESLTQQNRQLVAELDRIRSMVRELVDLAWDRWTTGDISNELLERMVVLNNTINESSASSLAEPSYSEPPESSYGQTQASASLSERSSMPFAESPDTSIFQDDRQPYALASSLTSLTGSGSTAQTPQVTQPEQGRSAPPEGTVSLSDIERNPRIAFCCFPTSQYNLQPYRILGPDLAHEFQLSLHQTAY